MILVDNSVMEGSVAPFVRFIDIRSSKQEHLNEGVVIIDGGYLKTIIAVFFIDRGI